MQGFTCLIKSYKTNMFRSFQFSTPSGMNIKIIYKHCIYIYICIIASNDNNQCMQFVCPYCGPIDWNNKYSYSYSNTFVYWLEGMISSITKLIFLKVKTKTRTIFKKRCTMKHKYYILLRTVFH
jgi:hypothetical protein